MRARSRAITAATFPASPTIIPKNMPGAGSARAAGFISTLAPKDGTAIAAIFPGAVMGPLLEEKAEALFDPTKVFYLGTANNGTRVCVSRQGSKIKVFDDALTQKASFGGVSTNDSTREYGYMHKKTSGAQYNVVSGYSGTAEIALALERGEIDGACGWDWASLKSQRPDWISEHKVNLLLQDGVEPNPELTRMGVPSGFKYIRSEEDRKAVELVVSQQVFLRSYIAPPDIAKDLLDVLRAGFDATMKDPQFMEDAQRLRIDISPLPGAKVQDVVQKLYGTPRGHRRSGATGDQPVGFWPGDRLAAVHPTSSWPGAGVRRTAPCRQANTRGSGGLPHRPCHPVVPASMGDGRAVHPSRAAARPPQDDGSFCQYPERHEPK